MRFDIFTLFPGVITPYLETSILQRARQRALIDVQVHDIRAYTTDRHHVTDDLPYGGGGGMVMKPEPVFSAVESVLGAPPACPVVLLTPQGRVFNQSVARELSALPRLALLCGRYEGVDERIRQYLVTDEISIGDFVLTGGELPALMIVDGVARLLPGVLGDPDGAEDDSHASGLLEYPHYTRPPEYRGWAVPEVLLSGHHAEIQRWRRQQSLLRTLRRRPDMLEKFALTAADRAFLATQAEPAAAPATQPAAAPRPAPIAPAQARPVLPPSSPAAGNSMLTHAPVQQVTAFVSDYHAAMAFYHDLLGLAVVWQDPDEGNAGLDAGGLLLILAEGAGGVAKGGMYLTFTVNDLHSIHETLIDAGVYVTNIQDTGDFLFAAFTDPDGNRLGLMQPTEAHRRRLNALA